MVIHDIRKQSSHNRRNGDRSFYQSSAWTKTRNAFIAANPKCIQCGKPANVADHKVRIKDGGSALDWSNLQAMCSSCHNKKDNNAGKRKI
jgi:5-methylcytosine-specific restriction endonuclease McrA